MGTDRRGFLVVAGMAGLGLVLAKPAIELFSRLHPESTLGETEGLSLAGTSQKKLAMLIDVKKCDAAQPDCGRICETACHEWHNVPINMPDPEEEIKWIWQDKYGKVFEEHLIEYVDEEDTARKALPVKLLCNQCTDPPCIKYCPTRATWKREPDGIIMIDFHRCIGCRYCMAGCPYGARSFNWRNPRSVLDVNNLNDEYPTRTRGVVEKCNFCADRLDKVDANGDPLIPACVEACQAIGANALVFGDIADETTEISKLLKSYAPHILRRLPDLGTGPNNYYILNAH